MKNITSYLFLFLFISINPMLVDAQNDTLRVFVLAGQSNMLGWGLIYDESTPGTLEHTIANNSGGIYDSLVDGTGEFTIRNDVWISMHNASEELITDRLSAGFGGYDDYIGPEYGFGYTMGDHIDDDVLIIKTAWGGRSLAEDFRPPSSSGATGEYYQLILDQVNTALADIPTNFPALAGQPYKIEGFGWFQGWNDGESAFFWDQYEENLINLIGDMRVDLNSPDLPVVVANSGFGGFNTNFPDGWLTDIQMHVAPAQLAATEHPAYEGTVALAETRPFWVDADDSPSDAIHHWNDNAYSYLNIGQEMGFEMIELLNNQTTVSTEANPLQVHFGISPNPTDDYLRIYGIDIQGTLVIHNTLGAEMLRTNQVTNTIDVSQLSKGFYFVSLLDEKGGSVYSSRFIKR